MPPLQQVAVVRSAVELYAAQGFTTVQNGLATLEQIKGMSGASKVGLIPQRLVLWPKDELGLEVAEGTLDLGQYASDRVHIGAAKFVGDGSIQGYTGFLSEPYYQPGEHAAEYRGYPNIDAATLKTQVKAIHCSGQQVAVHGNGDAAIDQFLDAWEAALEACPADDARPVLVHAQMSRADQLERMKKLGVTPSFFSAHVYYWGDRHRDLFLGPERAARISPAASALALGLPFTTHLDTPIVPIDSMLQLWTPVARETSSGQALGHRGTRLRGTGLARDDLRRGLAAATGTRDRLNRRGQAGGPRDPIRKPARLRRRPPRNQRRTNARRRRDDLPEARLGGAGRPKQDTSFRKTCYRAA